MGASGSDVARESADLVLLDDHFATIVTAIELGRATFRNIRRFLTYHLTDNVAELAPFALWAMTGGSFPLAIGVLQVLALDIGTDMLPALALGREPPRTGHHEGPVGPRAGRPRAPRPLVRPSSARPRRSCRWAPSRSSCWHGGWTLGQHARARPARRRLRVRRSPRSRWARWPTPSPAGAPAAGLGDSRWATTLVLAAVAAELVLLVLFLGVPWLAELLGGAWPSPWAGWQPPWRGSPWSWSTGRPSTLDDGPSGTFASRSEGFAPCSSGRVGGRLKAPQRREE